MSTSPKNISIRDFHLAGEISMRSLNVCSRVNILTIQDLHDYLEKHQDFLKVKNCGLKSNLELLSLHKEYFKSGSIESENADTANGIARPWEYDEAIEKVHQSLSVRAQHALARYFKEKPVWHEIVRTQFIEQRFSFSKLKNVGVKTEEELSRFINYCTAAYRKSDKQQPSVCEISRYALKKLINISIAEDYIVERYSEGRFPIILFAKLYFQEVFNFDQLEKLAIESLLGFSCHQASLDEIAKYANLTKERVRQKRERALEKIEVSSTLKTLLPYTTYREIVKDRLIVHIPSDIADTELAKECIQNGTVFSTTILGVVLGDEYYSLTKNDRLKRPSEVYSQEAYCSFKRVSGNYLIKHNSINKHDILTILNSFLNRLVARRNEDVFIDLRDLLSGNISEEALNVIERVFQTEYGLTVKNCRVTLKRNTPKLVYEYAEEALETTGEALSYR